MGGEIFRTCTDRPLASTQPLVQWVPGLSRGKERPGRDADPSPTSSSVGHERVELYFYSPYGPYGLYRASVPVQGCTLPLPYNIDLTKQAVLGRNSSVGIATGYGLDGLGIESRWGSRYSAPVQTGPGANPASCTMGTGSFPGQRAAGA